MKSTAFVLFFIMHFANAQEKLFPNLKEANDMRCFHRGKSKIKEGDGARGYSFNIIRDSIFSFAGNDYYLLNSNIFFPKTYLRYSQGKVLLITLEMRWKQKLKESLLFDFTARPSQTWTMADSTAYENTTLELIERKWASAISDTLYKFSNRFPSNSSHGHILSAFIVSKLHGVLGLEFTENRQVERICYDKRIRRYFKSSQ